MLNHTTQKKFTKALISLYMSAFFLYTQKYFNKSYKDQTLLPFTGRKVVKKVYYLEEKKKNNKKK